MIDTIYDMDTGEYETNALVINNISFVNFAFYESISPASTPTSFGPGVLELEATLQKDGFLVHFDVVRRGLWCFRLSQKDRIHGNQPAMSTFQRTVAGAGFTFSLSDEGILESAALVKNRPHGLNSANTPASSSSSSGSAVLDPAYRSAQSATLPSAQSFPTLTNEQDSKTVVSVDPKVSSTSVKDAYEHFVFAALSAVSSSFCANTGAIPLSSRTLLLSKASYNDYITEPAILASLRIYLTTTGSLVISVTLSPAEGIINLSENLGHPLPSLSVTVLAAPLGMFATCHPITISETTTTEGSFGQSPDTQVVKLRSEKDDGPWRNVCFKFLQARNIPSSLSTTQTWIGLQRMRRKPTEQNVDGKRTPLVGASNVSWPANLCFCKMFSRLAIRGEADDQSVSPPDQNFDTLRTAKKWFLGGGERDETLAKNKKERDAAIAREVSVVDGQAQHTSGLSPLTLRRSSNNAPPPGGLYPTPPDGVQNIVGATPSIDGTSSSPGNNATNAAIIDMDTNRNVPSYGDNWEITEVKRERIGNSFESENLFGELGPDMFGDNDITEADFNFFDEQPGDMGLDSLDLPGISNTDSSIDLVDGLPATQEPQIKSDPQDIHLPDVVPSPIFAKPELRHARSSLGDEARRQVGSEANRSQPVGVKRPASPFNPDTVFKRVRASFDSHKAVQNNSHMNTSPHGSIFDKVNFGPCLSIVNSKYEGHGRFDYSIDRLREVKPSTLNEPPTTDYLRRHARNRKGLKELPGKVGQLLIRASGTQAPSSNRGSPSNIGDAHSDADEISLVSDQDDSSYDSDESSSPVKSSSVRRRLIDDDGESLATSFKELESVDISSPHLPLELPQFCKSEADLPLTKYFADPEPPLIQYSLPDDQLIMAAQILTDQFSTGTLFVNATSPSLESRVDRRRRLTTLTRRSIQDIKASLPSCLALVADYQFRSFIELQDVPLLGQPTRMQPRPPGVDQMRPSNLFQIPSPHFELRRYESKLSVLPSAVAFWESLGLSPSPGNKDINAICIFPEFDGLADDMLVFTDRMRSIYESLKLGSFNRLPTTSGVENGLFSFTIEKDPVPFSKSSPFLRPSLASCASKVCQVLASMSAKEINFVVFFVYSPDATGSIVESCAAFNQIFEGYKRLLSSKKSPVANDLALQLLPQDFVTSSRSVAMPSPFEFSRLAMETYDRCTQFSGSVPSPPAIMLEQPPPRIIDFKLTTNPSASLLHENTCLHIAYAQSIDGRWVTAAWSDNRGSQQMTASYCLGRKGKSLSTSFADIATEIWGATRDFISAWKVHWRVIIAKCGTMEHSEIELWSSLAQAEDRATISLTLVTVDTDPSMQLLPPIVKVSNNALSVFYTTPVSTPQGSMVSPEQSGNPTTPLRDNAATSAPTPGGDNSESDGDATLTEITDQTWGAVLSHRLNNSTSLTELNPALISGYLVKRGGTRVEDPPVVMEVNIVHNEGNPRAYESLLREMLTYYRGLGTLARARGTVERETDIRPWHIAAAEKAVKALYMLM